MQKEKTNSKTQNVANSAGAYFIRLKKQQGITLIALIITIIVMLILVGVTINVALNGGLFGKAKKATYQTEASTIKEQLEIAKAIKISENKGKVPSDYGITIENLDISDDLKSKYKDKLVISADGVLYYDSKVVTDANEIEWLEEIGMNSAPIENWVKIGENAEATLLSDKIKIRGTGAILTGDYTTPSNGTILYWLIDKNIYEIHLQKCMDQLLGLNMTVEEIEANLKSSGNCTDEQIKEMLDYWENPIYMNIKSIEIAEGINEIGANAFAFMTHVENMNLPSTISIIGKKSISYLGISTLEIPDGVTTIETYTIYGMNNLETVKLPSTIETIGSSNFKSCDKLATIYIDKTESECSGFITDWNNGIEVVYKAEQ